jgi:hypothetical protein
VVVVGDADEPDGSGRQKTNRREGREGGQTKTERQKKKSEERKQKNHSSFPWRANTTTTLPILLRMGGEGKSWLTIDH